MPTIPTRDPIDARNESQPAAKSARFAARLSPEQREILEHAAALNHQPLSQFVISSAQRAAEALIAEHDVIRLSLRDSQAVMEVLLNPPPAGPRLRRAAERYREVFGDSERP